MMWGNGVAPYIVSVLPDLEHSRVGGIVHFNNQEDFNRIRACLTHREPGGGLCERDPLSYIRNPSRGTRECVIQRRRQRGVCGSGITQIDVGTCSNRPGWTHWSCGTCSTRRACKCGSGRSSEACGSRPTGGTCEPRSSCGSRPGGRPSGSLQSCRSSEACGAGKSCGTGKSCGAGEPRGTREASEPCEPRRSRGSRCAVTSSLTRWTSKSCGSSEAGEPCGSSKPCGTREACEPCGSSEASEASCTVASIPTRRTSKPRGTSEAGGSGKPCRPGKASCSSEASEACGSHESCGSGKACEACETCGSGASSMTRRSCGTRPGGRSSGTLHSCRSREPRASSEPRGSCPTGKIGEAIPHRTSIAHFHLSSIRFIRELSC